MNTNKGMELLKKYYNVKDKRVLELGALSGEHTKQLISMGAKEVIAIEGRKSNFDLCLDRKLKNVTFIHKNIEIVDFTSLGVFDLCVASKILHHLTNPIKTIMNLSKVADNIFIFYRVASKKCPDGKETVLYSKYKGKKCSEGDSIFSGLSPYSVWLYKEDLLQLLNDVGYKNINIIAEGREKSFIPHTLCNYIILIGSKNK